MGGIFALGTSYVSAACVTTEVLVGCYYIEHPPDDREADCDGLTPADPGYNSAGCGGWTEQVCNYESVTTCEPDCQTLTDSVSCDAYYPGYSGSIEFSYTYCDPPPSWSDYAVIGDSCQPPPVTCTTEVLSDTTDCSAYFPDTQGTASFNYEYTSCTDGSQSWGAYEYTGGCSPIACTSASNSCGQTNTGVISGGVCSASAPANPVGYGNSCVSSSNSCGQTNTGTVQCDGSCSAVAPSDSSCLSASISATSCVIAENANTCTSYVTWSSSNATAPSVRQNGSIFSTDAGSSNHGRAIQYGVTTFSFYDGGTLAADSTATASCASGTTWNGSSCVTNAPSTPTGLSATAVASCGAGSINVSWNTSPTATGYIVQRNGVVVYTGTATSFSDTGLSDSTVYTYTVRAYNAGGNSAYSSGVSATTAEPCPAGTISSNVSEVPYNGTATISWSASYVTSCTVSSALDTWTGTSHAGTSTSPLTTDTTYVLVCDGNNMDSVTIDVLAIPTLSTQTRIVPIGSTVNLEYTTNSQTCTLSGGAIPSGTTVTGTSVYPVTVQAKTTYTLTCPGGTVQATTEVVPRTFET